MKTSFAATVALALFAIPAVASAASVTYDPSAGNNGDRFVAATVDVGSAKAAAALSQAPKADATVATFYDPSAGNNGARFVDTVVAN